MKALFDTNLFIPAEPTRPEDIEPGTPIVIDLIRLLNAGGHQIYIHPESLEELARDRDIVRRTTRATLLEKYLPLPAPPAVSAVLEGAIGCATKGTHDAVDHALLAAIHGDAVHFLVTADQRIHSKAARALIGDRVFTPDDCVAMLRGLAALTPTPPPAVDSLIAHQLDEADPIFASFRGDYPGFDDWLRTCKREHRQAWVVRPIGHSLQAVSIVKPEPIGEYGMPDGALKICTFKVSDSGRGFRYGELMLKAVFEYAFQNRRPAVYVTIFPKYGELIALFEEFGFCNLEARTGLGEVVLMKRLTFTADELLTTPPLQFNIRFGPHNVKLGDLPVFVVPIRPTYHERLFPDAEYQVTLFAGLEPFGNSIAKAYLCHAQTRQIEPGSLLLFYRSQDHKAVRCIGVAERTLVSSDAAEIARFVGKRTVYRYHEIEQLCAQPTLAIRFRHARVLPQSLGLAKLVQNRVLTTAPQSITKVREEGRGWLRDQMEWRP